jgi:hypothetical protein
LAMYSTVGSESIQKGEKKWLHSATDVIAHPPSPHRMGRESSQ